MEQPGNQMDSLKFSCSICLDLLKDPVTIPCGHSYCMNCIKVHWDEEDRRRVYSCPQCRQTSKLRPVLVKNFMLAELVEDLKKTGLQAAPADHCYAGLEDVACDVCTGRKRKAVKSCLVCLVSYCKNHLKHHYDVPGLKKHKLVNPSKNLQENICSRHDEVMKIFCRTDQQCICYLCTMDEHKGHETVPAAAERAEKQKELQVSRQQIQQRIQDRENDVKLLQQEVEAINASAGKAVEDSEEIFTELIRLLQKRSSDVKQQIRSQQETEVSRVQELQEKLEQEIPELKRKDAELEQLSNTEDHNQFLLNCPSLSALSESTHSSRIKIRPLRYFMGVTAAVSELRDIIQDVLRDTWTNISLRLTEVDVLLSEPEPKSRAGFLKFSQEITLDPNTANTYLLLSEENRKLTRMKQQQSYPDHPDRFTFYYQVLSRESLTGRCYWEVEWRGGGVVIGVSYKNIKRAGDSVECLFGFNDKSWSLRCDIDSYRFWHNYTGTPVSGPVSSRLGVYLDHRAGILSFYSVSETMTLLHRVQTTFTEPLHAGVWLFDEGDSAEFKIHLVENLKKTSLQDAPADHCYAGPDDVACDVCTGRKRKAVKFCLVCLVSYCENHIKHHYEVPALKKHNLFNPSKKLHDSLCSHHNEMMKILMNEFETVTLAAERAEKQKELQVRRQQIQQRIQDQEKDVKLLQQEVEAINASADKAVEDSEKIFTELIRLLQKRSSDVKQQIRSQQETEVSRVQELQEKLEQKITELKRKDAELEQLSDTEDHNQFLLNCPSLSALSESTHSSRIKTGPLRYFEDVTAAVSELRDKLQDILRDTWTNISLRLTEVDVLLYCMNCIKEHWDGEDQRKIQNCPQCRKEFIPRPDLVKNIMLADLVEDLKKTRLQAAPVDHCYAGHEDVAAERAEKQMELQVSRQQIQQRIQDQEKEVKLLQQEVEAINASADKAVEDSEKIFTELIRLLQKRSSDVKQQIRSQQETEVSRVKELQEKLEKITELKRKDAELEQLSNTEDHNQFLLNCPSLPALSESTHSSRIRIRPLRCFEDVTAAVSELRDKLQDVLRDTWTNISLMITEVDVLLSEPEPETRAQFLKYSQEITLDPNTANRYLLLTEGNRKATRLKEKQSYPDHPDRFTGWLQVLSRESLTGRCYWEVEMRGGVIVAVSYKNISRVGGFGLNDKSWSLRCDTDSYIFYHNNIKTPVSGPVSSRLGVYLDHRAGILSFYSVSETMTLLHRVQTTFTQPLHAGVSVHLGPSAEFIKLK
ncbi:uncharacterized protein FYW61_018983 [Anableps anableps]